MESENKTETTPATTPAAPASPSAEDIQKIIDSKVESKMSGLQNQFKEKIADVETKAFKQVTDKIVEALDPREKEKEIDPFHAAFANTPREFVSAIIDKTKKETLNEVAQRDANSRAIDSALATVYESYPDLKKVPNEIHNEFLNTKNDLPIAERIKIASDNVSKRLGFKSAEESNKFGIMRESTMTPSGTELSYTYTRPQEQSAAKSLADSAKDYMKAKRDKYIAVTGRGPISK